MISAPRRAARLIMLAFKARAVAPDNQIVTFSIKNRISAMSMLAAVQDGTPFDVLNLKLLFGTGERVLAERAADASEKQRAALELFPQANIERHIAGVHMEVERGILADLVFDQEAVMAVERRTTDIGIELGGKRLDVLEHQLLEER